MTCFYPLQAYRSVSANSNGKYPLIFNAALARQSGAISSPVKVACYQCIGCRIARSKAWSVRCMHEASLWDENCFITLTYSDGFLPHDGSLVKSDFQKFMKRFRERVYPRRIRYYMCGEYGGNFGRPHFHALIFNYDFPDKKFWTVRGDSSLYTSEFLSDLWPFGYSSIGSVTYQSAAYVARYVMKKVNGAAAEEHYRYYDVDLDSGEILGYVDRLPEYTDMSRRPGIARDWFERFGSEVYLTDSVVTYDGKEVRPPKYYDNLYELSYPSDMERVKDSRRLFMLNPKVVANSTPDRLDSRRICLERKVSKLVRELS